MNKQKKTDRIIGLGIMFVGMLLSITDLNRDVELIGYDFAASFSSTKSTTQDVVIIKIDEASLQAKGGWPWPRDILAEATRIIAATRPAVIGYVLPFDTEQSTHGKEYIEELQKLFRDKSGTGTAKIKRLLRKTKVSMETDQRFADSLSRAGRIVLSIPFLDSSESKEPLQGLAKHVKKYALKNVSGIQKERTDWEKLIFPDNVLSTDKVYSPIKTLVKQASGAGTLYLGVDSSNVRAEPLVLKYGKDYLPSFALMVVARSQSLSTRSIDVDLEQHKIILAKNEIMTDKQLRVYPRFYRGENGQPAFAEYSMIDLFNGKINRSALYRKTILIGVTAPQHVLPQVTPIGETMPPVRVMAHKITSLFNDDLYVLPSWILYAQLLVLFVLGLYLVFLLPRFRIGTGIAMSGLLLLVLLNVQFVSMLSFSTWLPMMTAIVVLVVGHLILATKNFINAYMGAIRLELSQANQLIGQSFHAQGNLDQAMEKYRKCIVDKNLLEQMYNLGLDYERKRQFNKAIHVFASVQENDKNFRDVTERLNRNKEVSNAALGSTSNSENETMVVGTAGMEKPMLGRYQIDKEIGQGAMGMVYLGQDPKIGRTVAVKTLKLSQEFDGDKLVDVKERFFREAETAGRLNHPNIVTIYDVGEDQDMSYIAMDYLKGFDLSKYTKVPDLLPVSEVLMIIAKAADALGYAHKQKVVHRDIKPANMIYDKEMGVLKITDFGIACLTDTSKTKTGTILGSPSYMSPEQIAGKRVDGRSDLYSLGVMMYQMLSGELPFIGDSLATLMYKITSEPHTDISLFRPDLPRWIVKFIDKALAKDIEQRFQSGKQIFDVIQRYKDKV